MRELPEWIGETSDTRVPPHVKMRVWDACGGRCAGTTCNNRKIHGAWELDHRIALINGGENRESNLQVLCIECHAEKTGIDVAEKSKTYRMRAKHLGIPLRRKRRW